VMAGRPCALANMIPLGTCYGFGTRDISIVKYLRDKAGRDMSFADILHSELSRNYSFLKVDGLSVVENSADEIRDLAVEMLDMLDGRVEYSKEDEDLQATFRALLDDRQYSYGASGRIGRDFLRKNARLLKPGTTNSAANAGEVKDTAN
jgi:putative glycosyltransferase (TIGR04372 family)